MGRLKSNLGKPLTFLSGLVSGEEELIAEEEEDDA